MRSSFLGWYGGGYGWWTSPDLSFSIMTNIRRPWGRYSGVPVIWRHLPRSDCIRFSRTRRPFVPSGPLDPVRFLPLLLSAPPSPSRLLFSSFGLLRRSLIRHRPVGSLLSLWRLPLEQAPGFLGDRVQVCFCPFSQCKNAHPEITPYHKNLHLRFNISRSSIDPCPPFRAKRTDKALNNLRLKTDRRFSRAEPPPRAPGPG